MFIGGNDEQAKKTVTGIFWIHLSGKLSIYVYTPML
jgi:hypothetical protein